MFISLVLVCQVPWYVSSCSCVVMFLCRAHAPCAHAPHAHAPRAHAPRAHAPRAHASRAHAPRALIDSRFVI